MAQPESTGKKVASSSSTQSHQCVVYLCRAPIQNGNSASLSLLSSFASVSQRVCGNSWEKHWLVVFDYGEDAVLVCDADMDHSGALTGRKYWKVRTAVFNGSFSYKKRLGKHTIPKARIEEVMREMCDSGQYHLTNNNCQKWAKELLHRLGVEVPLDEPDAQAVVDDVVQPVARFTLLMGALAVAKFILFRGRV
uniref:LRAT domain-containing protein n=1 Tax=Rhipicephalus appendiculatus TaxID=34631 RepID=A0A131Z0J5_RHIAP